MTVFNGQVASGSNDARWVLGAFYSETSGGVYPGNKGGNSEGIIARFTGVTVPQGATISSASFSVYSFSANFPPANLIGKCADADNATMPGDWGTAGSAAKTTGTAFTVSWSGNGFQSVNITSEVQAVINRAGWVSGNSIVVYLYDNGSGSGLNMFCGMYDDLASEAPKLDITYTAGGGSGAVGKVYVSNSTALNRASFY